MSGSFRDLEKDLWGKASDPTGGGTPAPPQSSNFNRPLNWLLRALRLQSPNPPGALKIDAVISAMDVMQSGWPFAQYFGFQRLYGPAIGAGDILVPGDANSITRLIYLSLINGPVGPATMRFLFTVPSPFSPDPLLPATSQNPGFPYVCQATLAATGVATTVDILGGRDIIIPPGMTLATDITNIPAGTTVRLDCAYVRYPAGFRP